MELQAPPSLPLDQVLQLVQLDQAVRWLQLLQKGLVHLQPPTDTIYNSVKLLDKVLRQYRPNVDEKCFLMVLFCCSDKTEKHFTFTTAKGHTYNLRTKRKNKLY